MNSNNRRLQVDWNYAKLSPDIDGIVVTDAMMFLGVVEYILKNKKIFKNEIAIGTYKL